MIIKAAPVARDCNKSSTGCGFSVWNYAVKGALGSRQFGSKTNR